MKLQLYGLIYDTTDTRRIEELMDWGATVLPEDTMKKKKEEIDDLAVGDGLEEPNKDAKKNAKK